MDVRRQREWGCIRSEHRRIGMGRMNKTRNRTGMRTQQSSPGLEEGFRNLTETAGKPLTFQLSQKWKWSLQGNPQGQLRSHPAARVRKASGCLATKGSRCRAWWEAGTHCFLPAPLDRPQEREHDLANKFFRAQFGPTREHSATHKKFCSHLAGEC